VLGEDLSAEGRPLGGKGMGKGKGKVDRKSE